VGETTTTIFSSLSTDCKAAKVCITMLWPAMNSYCLGMIVPAREPEPAQGTKAKHLATGAVFSAS
jgi:hypothetical protein